MNEALADTKYYENVIVLTFNLKNINISNAAIFEEFIINIFSKNKLNLILDFACVDKIDSTCLGKIIRLNKTIKEAGYEIIICNTSYTVNIVFEISKMNSGFLTLYKDVETALKHFKV